MRIRKRSDFLSSLTSDLSQRREANEEHRNEEEEKGGERGRVQHNTHLSDQREIKAAPPSHLQPSKGDLPTIPLQGFQQLPAGNGCQQPAGDDRELETHRHPEQIKDEQEDEEDEENNMKEVGAKETRSNRGARGEYPSRASRRWCKGETVFPLKKRKAIDYRDGSEGDNSNDSNNKNSTANIQNGSDHHSEAAENKWKCSRMNGRGWRCSKPTLVGYSLCEHHLGKGRRIKTINTLLHEKQASKERTRKKGQGKGGDGGDDATAGSRSMNSLMSQKISSDHSDCINMDIMN